MTPKQKAKELVDNMMTFVYIDKSIGYYFNGKHCALIAVNEILSLLWAVKTDVAYWNKVKKEIEKL
jgi:hypothetical protein